MTQQRRVLITGANGFLGRTVVAVLAGHPAVAAVVALDIRLPPPEQRHAGVTYEERDVRDPALGQTVRAQRIDTVVHLASIVTPGKGSTRELEYSVDVLGSRNVLEACINNGVSHLVVSSSGAAYGYHADNPVWIDENDALRGNPAFAYADHKRQVEEMLADYRQRHPALKQTIFRIGTILGATVNNQLTAMFDKPSVLAIRGSDSPFVFIWDEDVTGCIAQAVVSGRAGVYNVAGDGALTIFQIAELLGKPVRVLPPGLLRAALWLGKKTGLGRYGPEQLDFLRYRPVLSNARLKDEFGYTPRMTSRQALDAFITARQAAQRNRA